MIRTIKRNNIDVAVAKIYDCGPMYECLFVYRYGINKELQMLLEQSRTPICNRKRLIKYISDKTKILADIWGLNPTKNQK